MPPPRDGDAFTFDIGYLVVPDFYYGPPNNFTPQQWGSLREPLPRPGFALFADHLAATAEVDSRLGELERHYARIVDLMRRHARTVSESAQYFWMRPFAWSGSGFALTFPWYDTLGEARTWIEAVTALGDGGKHEDMDEGWEMRSRGEAAHIVVEQSDGRSVQATVRFSREALLGKLATALERAGRQVAELTKRLGRDFWTTRPVGGLLA